MHRPGSSPSPTTRPPGAAGSAARGSRRRERRCSSRCCCARSSPPGRAQLCTMAAGVALAEAVEHVADVRARAEVAERPRRRRAKARGAPGRGRRRRASSSASGLNVEWAEFPAELAALATACNLEAGHAVDRDEVLDAFLGRLGARLADLDGDRRDLPGPARHAGPAGAGRAGSRRAARGRASSSAHRVSCWWRRTMASPSPCTPATSCTCGATRRLNAATRLCRPSPQEAELRGRPGDSGIEVAPDSSAKWRAQARRDGAGHRGELPTVDARDRAGPRGSAT